MPRVRQNCSIRLSQYFPSAQSPSPSMTEAAVPKSFGQTLTTTKLGRKRS